MLVAPKKLTQSRWSKELLLLAAALALATGSASAQSPLTGISLGGEHKRQLTPEEQEREKQIDNDYKAATKKIPDQEASDPWTGVRPTPTVKRQFKNESLTPYHRDSFNGH